MATASEKLRAYQSEITRKKIKTSMYAAFVVVSTVILVMLMSGDRFNRYLAFFGLQGISNREGGVYADCSLEENKSSPYCQHKENATQQEWQKLKNGGNAPFTLYK